MALSVVATSNLGADFDVGTRVSSKIGVSWAISPTWSGTHTFTASPVVPTPATSDNSTKAATTAFIAALLSNSGLLGALLATLPTTPPATAGQAWRDPTTGAICVS